MDRRRIKARTFVVPLADRERIAGEDVMKTIDLVGEDRVSLIRLEPERPEAPEIGASGPQAQVETTAGEYVDYRSVLGKPDRVLERQRRDAGPQRDPARASRHRSQQDQRRRERSVGVVEM